MRIFISTGEVSGDWHGAILTEALLAQARSQGLDLEIIALGGDRMVAAGAKLLGNTLGIGSIGLAEALPYIIPTLRVQSQAKAYLKQHPPDLVILIDYVGPNTSMGWFVKQHLGVPVIYYIAPQEWVWSFNQKNTNAIAAFTDQILAIFPEEARYYRRYSDRVTWVGHPLVELMAKVPERSLAREILGITPEQKVVVLLPASRRQEIELLLPIMLETATLIQAQIPDVQFWLPLALGRYRPEIETQIAKFNLPIHLVSEQPSQVVIRAADLVLSKSGTVNLETALLGIPQVVIYRVTAVTAWLARRVLGFSIPFMSPPNLVEMRAIVPEFLQEAANPAAIAPVCLDLLADGQTRQQMLQDYAQMRLALGDDQAISRVCEQIFAILPG
ncbi:MAG: lipid-A-disaccharide synthase [Pseudanabaenaceae cyanobacterium bins.68]|nr:lipid-A-disaccharide synthase [Pseudanabaenaceae cyanobacterium bins.68]